MYLYEWPLFASPLRRVGFQTRPYGAEKRRSCYPSSCSPDGRSGCAVLRPVGLRLDTGLEGSPDAFPTDLETRRVGDIRHSSATSLPGQPSTINHQPSTINHQPSTKKYLPTINYLCANLILNALTRSNSATPS